MNERRKGERRSLAPKVEKEENMKYRKKPVVIEAIQWKGGDYECLNDFCGRNWARADVVDMAYDDPEQVVLWNTMEKQYLNCPIEHWIVRGVKGELYPCEPGVFAMTYEPVDEAQYQNRRSV